MQNLNTAHHMHQVIDDEDSNEYEMFERDMNSNSLRGSAQARARNSPRRPSPQNEEVWTKVAHLEKVVGSTRSEFDARFVKELKKLRTEIDKKLKGDNRGTDKTTVDRHKNEVNKKVLTMEKDVKRMENSLAVQQKAVEVFKRETT